MGGLIVEAEAAVNRKTANGPPGLVLLLLRGGRLPERPREYRRRLEPGDRLLYYTDGIPEAREPSGELFGMERFADFVIRQEAKGLSAPETLRQLMRDIMRYQNGKLQDDAAVLLAEWRADTSPMMF